MSDEDDDGYEVEDRDATMRVIKEGDSSFHRIQSKFLDHITVTIRWDEDAKDARAEVINLMREFYQKMCQKCFLEIDVVNAAEGMDAELAYWFPDETEDEDEEDTDAGH